jgi:serine/threonine protein kinase/Flp pilus assembly protein TadD
VGSGSDGDDRTAPLSSTGPPTDQRPASYQLLRRLAVGGMGEIFLAREVGLAGFERLVVLKRLLPSASGDRERVALFIDEARVAAHLTHPNIVAIHDFGCDEQGFFIVMEYVAGQDLAAVQARADQGRAPISSVLAAYIVGELARGLAHAHAAVDSHGRPLRIIHRDVSPHNTLISYDGDVKLLDFGIAKAANAFHRTEDGVLRGKYGYMAPEQLDGRPLDARADVFAAGVMLWELSLGRRLFGGGDPLKVREGVRTLAIPAPRSVHPDYPSDLEETVMTALERDPDRRTASASELAAQLTAHLARLGVVDARRRLARRMRELYPDRDAAAPSSPAVELGGAVVTDRTVPLGGSSPTEVPAPARASPSDAPSGAPRPRRRRWWGVGAALALAAVLTGVVWSQRANGEEQSSSAGVSAAAVIEVRSAAIHQQHTRARVLAEELLAAFPDDTSVLATMTLASWWSSSPRFYPLADRARRAHLSASDRALVEGLFLLDTGRMQEAVAFLREQAARHPHDPAVAYAHGEALWHTQRLREGAAELERALHLDPTWAVGMEHILDYHLSIGTPPALRPLAARMAEHDAVVAAAVDAARAAAERQYSQALATIDRALEAAPDAQLLWRRRAELLAMLGDFEAGQAAAHRAFELDPVDDRDDGAFALWTEFFLYQDDLEGFRRALGGRGTRASMLVRAFWLEEADIGAPEPVRTDLPREATWQSRMPTPPLWAAVSLLGAHRRGVDARHYYVDHPMPEIRAYGEALAAERRGDMSGSADDLRRALDAPAVGDVRLLLSYHLARARAALGDAEGAAAACDEVIHPRVYAPYRAVLLSDCLRWRDNAVSQD